MNMASASMLLRRTRWSTAKPEARAVSFFLDGNDPDILPLVGDGLLPADIDGKTKAKDGHSHSNCWNTG